MFFGFIGPDTFYGDDIVFAFPLCCAILSADLGSSRSILPSPSRNGRIFLLEVIRFIVPHPLLESSPLYNLFFFTVVDPDFPLMLFFPLHSIPCIAQLVPTISPLFPHHFPFGFLYHDPP